MINLVALLFDIYENEILCMNEKCKLLNIMRNIKLINSSDNNNANNKRFECAT